MEQGTDIQAPGISDAETKASVNNEEERYPVANYEDSNDGPREDEDEDLEAEQDTSDHAKLEDDEQMTESEKPWNEKLEADLMAAHGTDLDGLSEAKYSELRRAFFRNKEEELRLGTELSGRADKLERKPLAKKNGLKAALTMDDKDITNPTKHQQILTTLRTALDEMKAVKARLLE